MSCRVESGPFYAAECSIVMALEQHSLASDTLVTLAYHLPTDNDAPLSLDKPGFVSNKGSGRDHRRELIPYLSSRR